MPGAGNNDNEDSRRSKRSGRDVTDVSEQALAARDVALAACEKALQTAAALNDALAAREASLTRSEQQLHQREAALIAAEALLRERQAAPAHEPAQDAALEKRQKDLARREATVAAVAEELVAKEQALAEKATKLERLAEEVALRENAADEAVSLASGEIANIEEQAKLCAEAEQLLATVRKVNALTLLEPRISRALEATNFNYTVLVAFYNMAVTLLSDELHKHTAEKTNRVAELQRMLEERDQALHDANAVVTSLKEDFDRHRNRSRTEQEAFVGRANEELLHRLVPVADNFARALAASDSATSVAGVLEGVKMINRQFEDVLTQGGLVPIHAKGELFDPKIHEALMEIETSEVPDQTVYEVIQTGYKLGGKLFRPALVKVARAPVGQATEAPAENSETTENTITPVGES